MTAPSVQWIDPLAARRVMYEQGGYFAVLHPIQWRLAAAALRWSYTHNAWFVSRLRGDA